MVNGNLIDGKKLAFDHEKILKAKVKKIKVKPKVVSILVGEDPASVLYSKIKQKKAKQLGIDFEIKKFPASSPFEDLTNSIKKLNKDVSIHGIMVQLPLPKECLGGRDTNELLKKINPKKDIDGLTSRGKTLPAAVRAVLSILENEKVQFPGKLVTIIGASNLVGIPLSKELKKRKAKVNLCDIITADLRQKTMDADVIVCATGVPGLLIGKMVKDGVLVIDVGISKVDGMIVGDVDFESVAPKASKITPVPGGVGPMTVISLMENVVDVTV